MRGEPGRSGAAGRDQGAVPGRLLVPGPGKGKLQYPILAAAAVSGGAEPDLLDEVAWWQTDDFWQYALYAAAAFIGVAADRAGVPVSGVCRELGNYRPAGRPASVAGEG